MTVKVISEMWSSPSSGPSGMRRQLGIATASMMAPIVDHPMCMLGMAANRLAVTIPSSEK